MIDSFPPFLFPPSRNRCEASSTDLAPRLQILLIIIHRLVQYKMSRRRLRYLVIYTTGVVNDICVKIIRDIGIYLIRLLTITIFGYVPSSVQEGKKWDWETYSARVSSAWSTWIALRCLDLRSGHRHALEVIEKAETLIEDLNCKQTPFFGPRWLLYPWTMEWLEETASAWSPHVAVASFGLFASCPWALRLCHFRRRAGIIIT